MSESSLDIQKERAPRKMIILLLQVCLCFQPEETGSYSAHPVLTFPPTPTWVAVGLMLMWQRMTLAALLNETDHQNGFQAETECLICCNLPQSLFSLSPSP